MRFLLLSGLGPAFLNTGALDGTLFADTVPDELAGTYARLAGRAFDIRRFRLRDGRPLLRPTSGYTPHLPTSTVLSILEDADIDHTHYGTEGVWNGDAGPSGAFDVVGLSTTFIWDAATVAKAVAWVDERYPGATLVLGGQYSNLKYDDIMAAHPRVDYVIRGDAEAALPAFLRALAGKGDLADVPNLVRRRPDGTLHVPPVSYIDIEAHPSPTFRGTRPIVPYESMRGCPFTCKFCSFPAASPKWRYKSAEKIVRDWAGYAEQNGTEIVRAYDSTFTIPPTRFKKLLELLPSLGVPWEAYSRANTLGTREVVERLEASKCRRLFIGFEAMNTAALKAMDKKVSVEQNHRAIEALRGSSIEVRASFIVGYPGETPEDYQLTHDFLVRDYEGLFNVHFFLFNDETMPVWDDAPLYDLDVTNAWTWKHSGMDSMTAIMLRLKTLREVRWKNDRAVHDLWQPAYVRPFVPEVGVATNLRIEKAIERLGHLVKDLGDGEDSSARCRALLEGLEADGVDTVLPVEAGAQPVERLGVSYQ